MDSIRSLQEMWGGMVIYNGWETLGLLQECLNCGAETGGFDEAGPLCINCAVVKAMLEGEDESSASCTKECR